MARTALIVDDHPSFRSAARRVLEDAGYEVVAEAADGTSALAAVQAYRPDIMLLDVQLPDIDGFEVAARVTGRAGAPLIVLTSSRDARDFTGQITESGARGFVAKADLSGPALDALVS